MLQAVPELQFPTPPLADKTVLLRPWREADVPNNLMAFGDPVIQRFSWSQAAPFTEEDARAYFVDQEQGRRRGEEVQFALVDPRMRTTCWVVALSTKSISRRDVPPSGIG
jgi:RimJ/RimL family protein N-acetyltransferase